jgi:uncharacterized membrane protein
MLIVKPKKDNDDLAGQAPQPEAQAEPTAAPAEVPVEAPTEIPAEAPAEVPAEAPAEVSKEPPVKRKRKRHPIKSLLRVLLALVIIAGGIVVILLVVAHFAKYTDVFDMLEHMRAELALMWQRIRS